MIVQPKTPKKHECNCAFGGVVTGSAMVIHGTLASAAYNSGLSFFGWIMSDVTLLILVFGCLLVAACRVRNHV